ncbi:putative reverse transcriptase domain-containing protein [Tanacetum coccineum]
MLDLEDSTLTYTDVSSPFTDLSDIGSSGVIVYGYDGLPMMPEDPYVEAALQATPSPDYVSSPEEPEQAPPSPVYVPYVPEPVYPEFMPLEDEMLPGDDDDDESYNDDEDDDDVKEDEDEEEHPAPAEYILPPHHAYRVMARYEVRESSSAPTARPTRGFRAEYGFVAIMDREIRRDLKRDVGIDALVLVQRGSWRLRPDCLERLGDDVSTAGRDCSFANSGPHTIGSACGDTETDEYTADTETTTTTSVTNAQLKALIEQGVAAALAARDADRSMNGDDRHNLGKGTEGVVELTQWLERMETVFCISNYTVENQVKFATCTLLGIALTWWNSHVRTVGHDVAYAMTWTDLKKKMTDKYCPRGENKKLEVELWNLKVKGIDVIGYNQRFQELALMCVRMIPEESDKIEKYVGGLPNLIHGSVMASKLKTMQDAIEMATELMDKKISTLAERQAENKRKFDDTSRNNQNQQHPPKRQNVARAYTAGSGERKPYGGSKPLCPKCNYHHDSPCAPKCHKCNRVGHLARDCKSPANANTANNQRGIGAVQQPTCYECRVQGHFKRECPKLKNNNRGNSIVSGNAPAKVYAVGNAGTNPDSNVITGTFLLNNRYASILFDTGVDRSFVSTAFSSQIDITPTALDHFYDVELADGRIIGLNTIIRGYEIAITISLLFLQNKTLIIRSDGSNRGSKTRLNIISCTKTQKYLLKGFPIFFAHVTTKDTEDKSKGKRLEDVPIVRDFPEVFPEYLPGIPPPRQVEFRIDLVTGVALVARAPYRLAPSEMKELSEQLKLSEGLLASLPGK